MTQPTGRSPGTGRHGSAGGGPRPRAGDGSPPGADVGGTRLAQTFERSIAEGEHRLHRSWPGLLATGAVGGIDLGIGVFALLVVSHETGSELLGGLAFGVGFVALVLAGSELFTENFLVPIAAVVARRAKVRAVLRLWGGTLVANLVGGWLVMGLVMVAFPDLREDAVSLGGYYTELGIGAQAFAAAILAGIAITLLTWMERGTESVGAKLVAAVSVAFVLAAGKLNHAVVGSLELFAGLHAGAPYGYLDWLGVLAWSSLGNLVGGLGLVTSLRLVQVGGGKLEDERTRAAQETPGAAGP